MASNPKTGYRKMQIPSRTRIEIAKRYGVEPGESGPATCVYCGAPGTIKWFLRSNGRPSAWVHFQYLELDHVLAEFHGGTSEPDNIVLACRTCNRRKGYRRIESQGGDTDAVVQGR